MITENQTSGQITVAALTAGLNDFKVSSEPNGWQKYDPIHVTTNGGAKVYSGDELGQVQVYCNSGQTWNWGNGGVTAPVPKGTGETVWPAGVHKGTYPEAYRWGVVLYQQVEPCNDGADCPLVYHQVLGTSLEDAQEIKLNPAHNGLWVAVNDGVGDYHDNSGGFSIHIKLFDKNGKVLVDSMLSDG